MGPERGHVCHVTKELCGRNLNLVEVVFMWVLLVVRGERTVLMEQWLLFPAQCSVMQKLHSALHHC